MVTVQTHGPKPATESNRCIGFFVCGGLARDLIAVPSRIHPFRAIGVRDDITHC